MKHTISKDRRTLTIEADAGERSDLTRQTVTCGIQSDEAMHDWFASLVANSELEWINPEDTGDLTSAPMLGISGEEIPDTANRFDEVKRASFGTIQCGQNGQRNYYRPILERWAFMSYQVRSVLEDLRDTGKAVFTS